MKYTNDQKGNGGLIYLHNDDDQEVGRLTYTLFPEDKRMVISFVLVHPQFEGRGMGKYLVQEGVRFARENNWSVYPHCSYARAVMNRMPEAQDILLKR